MATFSTTRHVRSLAAGVAAVLGMMLLAVPVAAQDADTDASFTITEGTGALTISVPSGSVDLGSAAFGGSLTGELGEVTVTDTRSDLYKTWQVDVQGTDFTASFETDGGTETATASAFDMTYNTEGIAAVAGNLLDGVAVPDNPNLGEGGTAVSFTGGLLVLSGDASWQPSIEYDMTGLDEQLPPGTYEGTITHSLLG
jgi:hypothetical protein